MSNASVDQWASKIRAWRAIARLRQVELAEATGLSRAAISAMECGLMAVTAERLAAIGRACGVADDVLGPLVLEICGLPHGQEAA